MDKGFDVMDWMSTKLVMVVPKNTILDTARLMKENNIGSILVEKDLNTLFHKMDMFERGELVGIITDSDIVRRVVAENKKPSKTKVSEVMSSKVEFLYENKNINDVIELFDKKKFKRVPIVREDMKPLGIITVTDMLYALKELKKFQELDKIIKKNKVVTDEDKKQQVADRIASPECVKSWMSRHPITTTEDKTILDVAKIMREKGIGALAVVAGKTLKGIITDTDIIKKLVALDKDPKTVKVKNLMTTGLRTIVPNGFLEAAIKLMHEKKCRRLPVVKDGELVGMISATDVMAAIFNLNKIFEASKLVDMLYSGELKE